MAVSFRLRNDLPSRVAVSDVVAALDVLPKLDATDNEAQAAVLRATGTEHARAEAGQAGQDATGGPRTSDLGRSRRRTSRTTAWSGPLRALPQPLPNLAYFPARRRVSMHGRTNPPLTGTP